MLPISISSNLLYSTTRIIAHHKTSPPAFGTAFFFRYKLGEHLTTDVLITNQHVIADAVRGEFLIHLATRNSAGQSIPSGEIFRVEVLNFEQQWDGYDRITDLCVLSLSDVFQGLNEQGVEIYYVPLGEDLIPSQAILENLSASEIITMVGYP